jgi:hypothetical protein
VGFVIVVLLALVVLAPAWIWFLQSPYMAALSPTEATLAALVLPTLVLFYVSGVVG